MNILYIILANLCLILIGYLIGSICFGIVFSKLIFKKDIRKFGSKSCGATNMNRIYGLKWAILVWFLDLIKIIVICIISYFLIIKINWFGIHSIYLIAAFGGLLGHAFPIYFKFKGGKVVSPFMGMLLSYAPFLFLVGIFFFVIVWLIWKKIGKSSVIFAIIVFIFCWLPWLVRSDYFFLTYSFNQEKYYLNYPYYYANAVLIAFGSIILIALHHENIRNEFIIVKKINSYLHQKKEIKNPTYNKQDKINN